MEKEEDRRRTGGGPEEGRRRPGGGPEEEEEGEREREREREPNGRGATVGTASPAAPHPEDEVLMMSRDLAKIRTEMQMPTCSNMPKRVKVRRGRPDKA